MRCRKSDGTFVTAIWKIFRATCPNTNLSCSNTSEAYVAAVTVCAQSLF